MIKYGQHGALGETIHVTAAGELVHGGTTDSPRDDVPSGGSEPPLC